MYKLLLFLWNTIWITLTAALIVLIVFFLIVSTLESYKNLRCTGYTGFSCKQSTELGNRRQVCIKIDNCGNVKTLEYILNEEN